MIYIYIHTRFSHIAFAEAARLGTLAAEKAEVSGAFTAQNWRRVESVTDFLSVFVSRAGSLQTVLC